MIAYYAHSEGSGHAGYASIFYKLFGGELKIFTSTPGYFLPETRIMKLAKEDPDGTGVSMDVLGIPDYLHYSPVGQHSIQRRSLQLLTGLVNAHCNLFLIDVSVEVASLARAASVPFAYIKLPGLRNDPAHLQAFKASFFNLAYYPEAFEHPSTPQWVRDKTLYLGYFSRFSFGADKNQIQPKQIQKILILRGKGEGKELLNALPDIAKRFDGLQMKALGDFSEMENAIDNMEFLGFQSQIEPFVQDADLIISSAGLNLTAEVLCAKKIFCCIPEKRPFMEQQYTASVLFKNQLAFNLTDLLLLRNQELVERHKTYDQKLAREKVENFVQWIHKNGSNFKDLVRSFPDIKKKLDTKKISLESIS